MVNTAATAKKFTFNREFDDDKKKAANAAGNPPGKPASGMAPAGQPAPQPQPTTPQPPKEPQAQFTQADLEAAREEGMVEGHTRALEEAETSRGHYVADALNLLGKGLEKLDTQQARANEEISKFGMRLTYAVLRKILPNCADSFATEEIDGLVKTVLNRVMDKPRLVVRVHQMIVDDVREKITPVFEGTPLKDKFTVLADYELQPGDCRIEWDNGGIERNTAKIWAEIDDAVSLSIGLEKPEALDAAVEEEKKTAAEVDAKETQTTTEHADAQPEAAQEKAPQGTERAETKQKGAADITAENGHDDG